MEDDKTHAELVEIITKTRKELFRLAIPAAEATRIDPTNLLYRYNLVMLAKYCHLLKGAVDLLDKNNYYSQIVIGRSMFEIKMNLRYFYHNPTELESFLKTPRKFKIKDIIINGVPDKESGEKDYAYYEFLCSIHHPNIDYFILLSTSKMIKEGRLIWVLTDFEPRYDRSGKMHGLFAILNDNLTMIKIEYAILKSIPNITPNAKLIEECNAVYKKYKNDYFLKQPSVIERYNELKKKRLQELK